jgi:hypothetical protein
LSGVTGRKLYTTVDGTPEKRLFLSIISDYDLKTGLCELVDNALDLWMSGDRARKLKVALDLNVDRQLITVSDNAGGVPESQVRLLMAPGASRNDPDAEVIGVFGVGGKRAGVALGEHVQIRTRHAKEKSLLIEITKEWIGSDDWHFDVFEISDIESGSTAVEISMVRQGFDDLSIEEIRRHLGETYSWFIAQGSELNLNDEPIAPVAFDQWAYPPDYPPRLTKFEISPVKDRSLSVTLTAGLINDRDEKGENYGVYFYCNHRLIVKELRTRDVGYFVSSEAGVPHPDASLCRVVVEIQGPAELMLWNSSKSGINYSHPAFIQLRPRIIDFVSWFSSLSRRLKREWDTRVFRYTSGEMEELDPVAASSDKKKVLPKLPRSRRPARIDELKDINKRVVSSKPWTLGLVEAMAMVDLIAKQPRVDTRNRIALILLDSNLEIAFKEYIVNRTDLFKPFTYTDAYIANLFKSRTNVIKDVQPHVKLSKQALGKINHYYILRNKLVHERATVHISDQQVRDYRETVEAVLRKLFKMKFPHE